MCVEYYPTTLLAFNKAKSFTLAINRKQPPWFAQHAIKGENAAERYLQVEIRKKVLTHLDFLVQKAKQNVNNSVGLLDPTVQMTESHYKG